MIHHSIWITVAFLTIGPIIIGVVRRLSREAERRRAHAKVLLELQSEVEWTYRAFDNKVLNARANRTYQFMQQARDAFKEGQMRRALKSLVLVNSEVTTILTTSENLSDASRAIYERVDVEHLTALIEDYRKNYEGEP